MENWMYGLIAIPVVAVGAAYGMGAFSTNIPEITAKNEAIKKNLYDPAQRAAFQKQEEQRDMLRQKAAKLEKEAGLGGKRKKKTKKSKSKNKKTKRRR
jgi:hypothetical protein